MNTQIRIGHFSPDAPNVNVLVDGEAVLENVAFGDISDYLDIESGSIDVSVVPAEGGDAVIETTLDLASETFYTVLAIGELDSIDALVLSDSFEEIDDAETSIRFVHLSPDAPAVDLTVVDGPTLFEGVEFGEAAEFVTIDADSYDVSVIPAGGDDVVLSLSDLTLNGGTFYTAFAVGTLAEDSLDAILVEDFLGETARRKAATR